MLERLRMQEVQQIILSVPEGAIINGTSYVKDEPIMIIEKPGLSDMIVRTTDGVIKDARGFIGASGLTNRIDFTINEGSVLYSVWSYLNGTVEEVGLNTLKGTEWLDIKDNTANLTAPQDSNPHNFILYHKENNKMIKLLPQIDYEVDLSTYPYRVVLSKELKGKLFVTYHYSVMGQSTLIKQIHNNIFCAVDIYFDAIDMMNDEHHTVCFHCDKAQIFMDLIVDINSSTQASFTPIRIISIPEAGIENKTINKDIGRFTII